MILLFHTCSHSPPILYLLTQEWLCFLFLQCPMGYVSYHRDCDVLDNRPDVFVLWWWRMKTWVPHADGHQAGLWRVCAVKWWLNEEVSAGDREETRGSISARVLLKTSLSTQSCPHLNTFNIYINIFQNNTPNKNAKKYKCNTKTNYPEWTSALETPWIPPALFTCAGLLKHTGPIKPLITQMG